MSLSHSQMDISTKITDKERMDWLVSMVVEVRTPLFWGSGALFHAQATSDNDEPYATDLRNQIDKEILASKKPTQP